MGACSCCRPGLAAGFDKNAEAVEALLGLGLGFMEIGAPLRVQPYTLAPSTCKHFYEERTAQ